MFCLVLLTVLQEVGEAGEVIGVTEAADADAESGGRLESQPETNVNKNENLEKQTENIKKHQEKPKRHRNQTSAPLRFSSITMLTVSQAQK